MKAPMSATRRFLPWMMGLRRNQVDQHKAYQENKLGKSYRQILTSLVTIHLPLFRRAIFSPTARPRPSAEVECWRR